MDGRQSGVSRTGGILLLLILLPALVFTAIPNIFWGFAHSGDAALVRMTQRAKALGGAYFSLEDFEKTQIDACLLYTSPSPRDRG